MYLPRQSVNMHLAYLDGQRLPTHVRSIFVVLLDVYFRV